MTIINRTATHEYTISDRIEAGIKLYGYEVKSAKGGHVSLAGSFVKIIDGEIFLVNAHIFPYEFARIENYDPRRTRKLLLSRKEILGLKNKMDSANLALVPLSMYILHGLVKVEIGIGKGKKEFEKRDVLKKRAEKRDIERQYRGKVS